MQGKKKCLLLVDDSPFFLNMLAPMLVAAGYQVITANNGQEALTMCGKASEKFDAVVSDIEMPGMTGYELAAQLRTMGGKWTTIPIVALSSHAAQEDLDHGKQSGFTDHIAKFDREALLKSIAKIGEAA
jgi:two-component system chemotaxis sensor kinase CheA